MYFALALQSQAHFVCFGMLKKKIGNYIICNEEIVFWTEFNCYLRLVYFGIDE